MILIALYFLFRLVSDLDGQLIIRSPELQLLKKLLAQQHFQRSDIDSSMPDSLTLAFT